MSGELPNPEDGWIGLTRREFTALIAGGAVTDYETGERIDGREAVYALETDPDRVDDPMGLNPAPFANRDDAEAYVEAVEYLSAEDIVGLDAFDRDLASQHRGRFLDES
jgi:copper chaperone NosL